MDSSAVPVMTCPRCGAGAIGRLGGWECPKCHIPLTASTTGRAQVDPARAAKIAEAIEAHRARGNIDTSVAYVDPRTTRPFDRLLAHKRIYLIIWVVWLNVSRFALFAATGQRDWRVYVGVLLVCAVEVAVRYTALFIDWRIFKQVTMALAVAGALLLAWQVFNTLPGQAPTALTTVSPLVALRPAGDLLMVGWLLYILWTDLRHS